MNNKIFKLLKNGRVMYINYYKNISKVYHSHHIALTQAVKQ